MTQHEGPYMPKHMEHEGDPVYAPEGDIVDTDYTDSIPANTRGWIHSVVGAVFALLLAFAFISQAHAAVIGAAVIAGIDLVLVLFYTRNAWRKALYPLLYAGGAALAVFGVFSETEIAAIIGLGVTMLGTQVASSKTPVTVA